MTMEPEEFYAFVMIGCIGLLLVGAIAVSAYVHTKRSLRSREWQHSWKGPD